MPVVNRDISRSRRVYSYFKPRPIYRAIATEEEMSNVNAAVNSIKSLSNAVNSLSSQPTVDNIVWNETPAGDVNGVNAKFTLAFSPVASKTMIFINGVLQERDDGGADYYLVDKNITFNVAPHVGDKIIATYVKNV